MTVDQPPRFSTTIGNVRGHTLYVECGACGGGSDLHLVGIDLPDDTPLFVIIARLRCARCGGRTIRDARLIWQGESLVALSGARQSNE